MFSPLELGAIALAGRALLAWLPPGRPGGHAPRDLAATWAASHLLGAAWLALWTRAADAGWISASSAARAAWAAAGLVLLVRLATLPAALVPRHEPQRERGSAFTLALVLLGIAAIVLVPLAFGRGAPDLRAAVTAAAALFLADEALRAWRTPSWARGASVLALGAAFGAFVEEADPIASFASAWSLLASTAAAAGAIAWLRRADARGLALAALASGASALLGFGLALVPICVLAMAVAFTPRPARNRACLWAIAAHVPPALFVAAGAAGGLDSPALDARARAAALGFLALFTAGIAAGVLAAPRAAAAATWNPSGAPRGHERRALLGAIAAAVLVAWALPRFGPAEMAVAPLLPALGVLAVLFGAGLAELARARSA